MKKGEVDGSYGEWWWLTKNSNNIHSIICKGIKVQSMPLQTDYWVSSVCYDMFGMRKSKGLQSRNSVARYISKLLSLSYYFIMTLFWYNRIDRLVVVVTSSLVCNFVHTVDRNIVFIVSCFMTFGYNMETMGHGFTGGTMMGQQLWNQWWNSHVSKWQWWECHIFCRKAFTICTGYTHHCQGCHPGPAYFFKFSQWHFFIPW